MLTLVRRVLGTLTALGLIVGSALFTANAASAVAAGPQVSAAVGIAMPAAASTKLPKRCKTSGRVLCIDKNRDKLYYVKRGKIITSMDARFGCASSRTREGTFHVFRKRHYTVSSLYGSPMPYSMFFSGGQAVHYSSDFAARGYNGCSHGCVNIRAKKKLHWVFHQIRLGDRVVVYRS